MTYTDFRTIEPKILYFGTPVALISSQNEDGTTNLAPMSSFWALGWTFLLGLLDQTKTADNLAACPECVINLPDPDLWPQVETLAPLTGKNPVPAAKADKFHYEEDKFGAAGLTTLPSESVRPARVQQCPVHLEARVLALHPLGGEKLKQLGGGVRRGSRNRGRPCGQPSCSQGPLHRSRQMVASDLQLPSLFPSGPE